MSVPTFAAQTAAYVLALWLGTFLLGRGPERPALRNTGLGLVAYAVALAALAVSEDGNRLTRSLLFVPALLWAGTLVHLLPPDAPLRRAFAVGWRIMLPLLLIGLLAVGVGTDLIFAADGTIHGVGYTIAVVIALAPLVEALSLTGFGLFRAGRRIPVVLAGLLLVSLSTAMLAVPADVLPRLVVLIAIGADLLLLGLTVAALDAFAEGEAWLPELLRSLSGTAVALALFAGPVALTMAVATGIDTPMATLLVVVAASAVLTQTFGPRLQAVLDDLSYLPYPRVRKAQAQLRSAAQAEVRVADAPDPAEFARLTRIALSHYGNLPRLAANPLTRSALVDKRVGTNGDTLERAAVLRQLLAESIDRLAPAVPDGTFRSADAWRHYNALYYPYVVGLRPNSRRATHDGLTGDARAALDWFRVNVPERTLYNWQSAAAQLVAKDLLEQTGA